MAEQKNTARSDKLRGKRESKTKRTPARKPRASQSASQNTPPVLVRGRLPNMPPPKQKKGKTPKRRFDIALSAPGVEMSLPAVPAVKLGWRLLSVVLTLSLLVLFYHFWTAPLYQVQTAELSGNHYLDADTVNRVLNLYNKPIFTVDPRQIEADLQRAFPGLLVASSVQIVFPASVLVTVAERQPLLAWEQGGEMIWIDAAGVSFDPAGENAELVKVSALTSPPAPIMVADVQADRAEKLDPLAEILTPEIYMTPEMVAAIMTMSAYAPSKSVLTYDARHGLGWHDEKRGWDVYFGMDISNIEEKLTVYKAIKLQLKENSISPVLISVEHVHAPYYRLEP